MSETTQIHPEKVRAYLATDYRLGHTSKDIVLTTGTRSERLVALFSQGPVDSAAYNRYLLTAILSGDYSMNSTEPLWGEWCEANRPKETETGVDDDAENEGEATLKKQETTTGTLPVMH